MSRPRFLADHDLNDRIVAGVIRREPTVEFVRAREVNLHERTDLEVLQYAAEHGLIVVSHDVNTMPAYAADRLAAGEPLAGLLLVHMRWPIGDCIDDLVLVWSASEAEEWQSVIAFLPL